MKVWEKPAFYTVTHLLLGYFGYFYFYILAATVAYQLAQLAMNKRFFILEMKLVHGNSAEHTALKLAEVFVGYCAGALTSRL
jgi:hypothetical protein